VRHQVGSSVNRQIFTGQEHDTKTGLIYFGARYYDPDTARFITQDPYLGKPGTPPSLNRYLYAYSNPAVYIDLYGYESVTTMLDKSAMKAADEGKDLKLAGIVALQAGYKLADFITFGFIGSHDKARDAYDSGEISGKEYLGQTGKAAAKSAALGAATMATGGAAGLAVKGASLTTRLAVAGAGSGVGYQATEDAFRGELSSASTYLKSAGMGALGGVVARGAMGLKSSVGKASVSEGLQVLKASASQKLRQLPKMTQAVGSGVKSLSQNLMTQGKQLLASSKLSSQVGSVGPGTRRLYLNEKFRGRANVDLDQAISQGTGYTRGGRAPNSGIQASKRILPGVKFPKGVGKKVAQHGSEWGLNPAKAADRTKFQNIVQGMVRRYDQVKQGAWHPKVSGGGKDFIFYRQGSNVVVTKPNGSFVTIMKDAANNTWFKNAKNLSHGMGVGK
jgi:RHS repeat-associated protein